MKLSQKLSRASIAPSPTKGGAKCGALDDKNDPELAKIVEVWPTLPEQIKTTIKDLIDKHTTEAKADGGKKEKG